MTIATAVSSQTTPAAVEFALLLTTFRLRVEATANQLMKKKAALMFFFAKRQRNEALVVRISIRCVICVHLCVYPWPSVSVLCS